MFLFPKIKRVECREALRWYAASSVYARSFHEYRGKRSIIKRNSSRLPSWLVLPRSCMPRASEEIRKRGWFSRFFVLGHLLLLFQYPLPPFHFSFFLLLFLTAYFVFLSPEACALWRWFVTGVQNNPRKSSERNRSKLCFGEVRRGDVNTRRWQRDSDFEYTSGQILSFSLEAFLY